MCTLFKQKTTCQVIQNIFIEVTRGKNGIEQKFPMFQRYTKI
jgi:hypothetical protein